MKNQYVFARVTKSEAFLCNALALEKNKEIIKDLIEDDFIRDLFKNKYTNDFEKNCIKNIYGQNLDYVIFTNQTTQKKYYEHLCNLNKYIV